MPVASVIIPTLGRSESIRDCLESLWVQSYQDFEIITITEEGPLAKLRNKGAKKARGKILIFIDDDVTCSKGWLASLIRCFNSMDIAGCSGPSFITKRFRRNRDLFRFPVFKWFYDFVFLDGLGHLPGHFTRAGAWTTGASNENCTYEGKVHFLEACNMAFRSEIFNSVGGFDESFGGIGDWSEPDICFRIRQLGHKLWFSRDARLEHRPSCSGAFKKRELDPATRLANYYLFSKRWIKPNWRHSLYKWFLERYYAFKTPK